MKTYVLAQNLENLAQLLRSLPNIEISHVLSSIINAVSVGALKELTAKTKNTNKASHSVRDGLELELNKLSPDELKSYFHCNPEGKALEKKDLVVIANRLGLATAKPQTRDAIINQLIRHFETTNMDGIIRSRSSKTEDIPLLVQNETSNLDNRDEEQVESCEIVSKYK